MDVFASVSAPSPAPTGRSIDTAIVKRPSRWIAPVVMGLAAVFVSSMALADVPAQLPPRKGAPPAAAPRPEKGEKADPAKKEMSAEERAQRGVVTIERAGQAIGIGSVLMGDGRILTALSPLGPGNDLDARFADGTTSRVKLGHHDRAWDLALLVPQTGRWTEGLAASSRGAVRPDAGGIRSFSLARNKIASVPLILRSQRSILGGDDKPIDNAIEIGSRVNPLDLGAPILDEEGRVLAILGRGCAPNDNRACTPVAFGAPISAIKTFLRTVPAGAVAPAPFLGIQGVPEAAGVARGVRILSVLPKSPAEEAKLRGGDRADGDTIIGVNGAPVTSPEALADAIRAHGVGEKVMILVFGQGKYREVPVTLRAAPPQKADAGPPPNPAELPPPSEAPAPAHPAPRRAPQPPTHR